MLLVYTQKITPRIQYVFKHICTRILGIEVSFTSVIEELIAYNGAKISYGKQALGNELFLQSHGLLTEQGIESIEINVKDWEDTKCFFAVSDKNSLPFDIFSASFYLLSRYEEYLPHVKDSLGRYPAEESIAFKENFLKKPVIDIWAYKFKKMLELQFPAIVFPEKNLKIHNIVKADQPYAYRQKGFFRSTLGFLNDIISFRMKKLLERTQVIVGLRRDPFDVFKWIITNAKRVENQLTVFFLLGENRQFNESINTHRQKFKMLIKFVSDYKTVGLIFSEEALGDYELLKQEKKRLEEITNRPLSGSINANFLIDLPEIYRNLVELEVENDFSMVYEDVIGFRAGTCTPFLFYDLDFEIKTPLVIHPLAATTKGFSKFHSNEVEKHVRAILLSVTEVNGTFSLLFKNTDFTFDERNKNWRTIFSSQL